MNIETENIIISKLNQKALKRSLIEMESMARQKHYELTHHMALTPMDYLEDVQEMIDNSEWQNFLPSIYYTLKELIK